MATTIKIELDNRVKSDSTQTILLRITQNRKLKRVALGLSVLPKHFNPNGNLDTKNWIRTGHPFATQWNSLIANKVKEALTVKEELAEGATRETISKVLKQKEKGEMAESFLVFAEIYLENSKGVEYNSYRGMKTSLKKFKDFLTQCEYKDLLFTQLDLSMIEEYSRYLRNELKNNPNTIEKELSRIKRIINDAVKKDKIPFEKNPFLKFKLKREPSEKVRLNETELDKIKALELPANSLIWNVRNAYMFSFYCAGIRCSDLLSLQWKNISEGRISYQMLKTAKIHSTKLPPQAFEILSLYQNPKSKPTDFIFPFFDNSLNLADTWTLKREISSKNALINKYLKLISEKAEIPPISFHTARHTFAFIGNRKTNNLYGISKALGHSNIRITQSYLANFDTKVIDDTTDDIYNNM
ncbi:MAG: tyrosine-type recombinase/integrase [Flavobacterium sp.]